VVVWTGEARWETPGLGERRVAGLKSGGRAAALQRGWLWRFVGRAATKPPTLMRNAGWGTRSCIFVGGEKWRAKRDFSSLRWMTAKGAERAGLRPGPARTGVTCATAEAFRWSSCYKTSHPAEERRMGHPVLFFGLVTARAAPQELGWRRGVTLRRLFFLSCGRGRSRRIWRRRNRRCRVAAR
jgi:hypothetical protein